MNSAPSVFKLSVICLLSSVLWLPATGQIEVTSTGDVGIGTSAPNYSLTIYNSTIPRLQLLNSSTGQNSTDGFLAYLNGTDAYLLNREAGSLSLATNNASRMTIDPAGNVGIGTTTPSYPLSFGTALGGKIALYDVGSGQQGYGFGIQNSLLQIFANTAADRVGIGYGNSGSFTETLTVKGSNVGIGTTNPGYKLEVAGTVRATSFVSNTTTYADFVFKPGYRLAPLSEVEAHIAAHGHLPDVPSEAEVAREGIDLATMQVRLLQKIEELTLHQIAQEKRLASQDARLAQLEAENRTLRATLVQP